MKREKRKGNKEEKNTMYSKETPMSEKKRLQQGIGFWGALALTVLLLACTGDFPPAEQSGEGGRAAVSVAIMNTGARTVFPGVSLSDAASYKLLGGRGGSPVPGGTETQLAEFSGAGTSVFLEPGAWDFTLNAYDSEDGLILQGKVENKQITLAGPNQITFYLSAVNSGVGAVQITITFPTSAGVTRISVSGDIAAEEFPITAGGTVDGNEQFTYTKAGIEAGDYFVSFRLFSADTLKAVVSELVLVRGNVTSGKTIALVGADLKPVPEPGSDYDVPEGGALIRINTQADLEAIRAHIDDPAYNNGKNAYVLQSDITLSGTWTPIGRVETVDQYGIPTGGIHAFSGNFYGNGHTIRNLILPGGSLNYIGLFGYVENVLIQDLQVELGINVLSVAISGSMNAQSIGIIAGAHKNSIIRNCGVYSPSEIVINGTTSGWNWLRVGGIASHVIENSSSIIENCYVNMDISATFGGPHLQIGGIAGNADIIRNCYYVGNITGSGTYAELRGIAHAFNTIETSYTTGKIDNNANNTGYTNVYGIGAGDSGSIISNSVTLMEQIYATVGVDYARRISEISSATLTNNYAYSGMLVNSATVTSNDPNSQNGLDKTAAQLKQRSTYESGLGWDFDNVWEMGPSSYPFPILKWQKGVVKLPQGFSVIGEEEASLDVSNASEFASALSAIQSSSDNNFNITVTADMNLSPQDISGAAYANKNITLRGNAASRIISLSSQGSLFTVGEDVELILENIVLQGREDNNTCLVNVYEGKLVLNGGGKITGNTNTVGNVGGVGVGGSSGSPGTFTMYGGTISGNATQENINYFGGGVAVGSFGTFTMYGGEISGNTTGTGGGVRVGGSYTATFTMYNGKISGNTSRNGGGVFVDTGGVNTFTMNGGIISGNTSGQGGGIYSYYGTVTMNDGEISGNISEGDGGGVYINSGKLIMQNSALVYGNTAGGNGGGVHISLGSATFTMSGGTVSGNTATGNGGGVYMIPSSTFTMSGGTVSGNTSSESGGGVYVIGPKSGNSGTGSDIIFTKTGGTITGYADDTVSGNMVKDNSGNPVSDRGHAVAVYGVTNYDNTTKLKETTAESDVNLSFEGIAYPPAITFSGEWDN